MGGKTVEMYWDVGSTNAYFALHLLQPILERHDAELVLHPFNLGFVFRKHNYVLMEEPPAKIANRKRDLERWAERYALPFRFPSKFPIKTSRTLRASLAMRRKGLERAFVTAVMAAYWERDDASVQDWAGMAPDRPRSRGRPGRDRGARRKRGDPSGARPEHRSRAGARSLRRAVDLRGRGAFLGQGPDGVRRGGARPKLIRAAASEPSPARFRS